MPRKRAKRKPAGTMVQFDLDNTTYQIDPDLKKVYRRFVEVETSRAAEIFAVWREATAAA